MNSYQYTRSQPARYADPTGLFSSSLTHPKSLAIQISVSLESKGATVAQQIAALIQAGFATAIIAEVLGTSETLIDTTRIEMAKGDKSLAEYEKHIRDLEAGKRRLEELKRARPHVRGKRQQEQFDKDIEEEEQRVRGHEKELQQKWPNGPPPDNCPAK